MVLLNHLIIVFLCVSSSLNDLKRLKQVVLCPLTSYGASAEGLKVFQTVIRVLFNLVNYVVPYQAISYSF